MKRRTFLSGLILGMLSVPPAPEAQQADKVYRIGLFDHHAPEPARLEWWNSFRQRLRERGWVEGKNVVFEARWGDGRDGSLPRLAAELVGLKVDVIVAASTEAILAAQRATRTIPIVITAASNPVETGMVASLARPGGNVTGTSFLGAEMTVKQLELLTSIVPGLSRLAVLSSPSNASHPVRLKLVQDAASTLKVQLDVMEANTTDAIDRAIAAIAAKRIRAVLILGDPFFTREMSRLAHLAVKNGLASAYGTHEYVAAGGLVSYSMDFAELFRTTADYVDKILKGAKPADLPVQQPTKFALVINLKTAKALGLTIPQSVLGRADQIIE